MLLALALLPLAHPADPAAPVPEKPFTVTPYGFVIPSFSWIQDDPAAITAQDGFQLAARLGAEAKLGVAPIGARVEVELTPDPLLRDGLVWYQPTSFFRVDAGQFKVPYSAGYLASDTRRLLPATPQAYADMTGRDMGVMLTGSLPVADENRATVQLGVFNGEGANRLQNVNQRYLYAVRGVVTPFGARSKVYEGSDGKLYLGVGGGWTYNWIGQDDSSEEVNQYEGELQFAWSIVSLQAEILLGQHAFASASVADYAQSGWYGTVATFVPAPWMKQHVQLVARVGQAEPDDQVVGEVSGQVLPNTRELTGGLNLYWIRPTARGPDGPVSNPFHDVKLQLAYSHFQELEGSQFLNDKLTLAGSVRF